MRYATVTLRRGDDRTLPVDRLSRGDDVAVEAIRHVSPGPAGQHVELLELRGDLEEARTVLAADPDVIHSDVTGASDRGIAYVQCRTGDLVDDLLAALYDHEIVVDWPIRLDADRGLRIRVVGTGRGIQRAASALPADVDLRLDGIGEYDPASSPGVLTERQRELLDLAVEEGYYEVPRGTTHRELAERLDRSTGTVSERLQRIEARLIEAYARRL